MADFVAALRQEIANLEAVKNLTDQRLIEARRMLALYEPSTGAESSSEKLGDIIGRPPYAPEAPAMKPPTRVPSPERARVLELARLFLANRAIPTATSVINDHIVSMGGVIGGADPKNNLSAMLSNSDLFRANGRSGWTLARGDESANGGERSEDLDESSEMSPLEALVANVIKTDGSD